MWISLVIWCWLGREVSYLEEFLHGSCNFLVFSGTFHFVLNFHVGSCAGISVVIL